MVAITVRTAAERLGVSKRRVNMLIQQKRLPATPFGNAWMIDEVDLALVSKRDNGRPKRTHDATP